MPTPAMYAQLLAYQESFEAHKNKANSVTSKFYEKIKALHGKLVFLKKKKPKGKRKGCPFCFGIVRIVTLLSGHRILIYKSSGLFDHKNVEVTIVKFAYSSRA